MVTHAALRKDQSEIERRIAKPGTAVVYKEFHKKEKVYVYRPAVTTTLAALKNFDDTGIHCSSVSSTSKRAGSKLIPIKKLVDGKYLLEKLEDLKLFLLFDKAKFFHPDLCTTDTAVGEAYTWQQRRFLPVNWTREHIYFNGTKKDNAGTTYDNKDVCPTCLQSDAPMEQSIFKEAAEEQKRATYSDISDSVSSILGSLTEEVHKKLMESIAPVFQKKTDAGSPDRASTSSDNS